MNERKPFAQRCDEECTRDVIFLFQRRKWELHGLPDEYYTDDGAVYERSDSDEPEVLIRQQPIPLAQIHSEGWEYGDWDHPCVTGQWLTEGVWLSREEATSYGNRRSYNYPDGWRVYGVCAEGDLAELIKTT